MDKKLKYDLYYMEIAKATAQMSHAIRTKVGAIAVRDGRILSQGWNGMPSGWDNTCEDKIYLEWGSNLLSTENVETEYPHFDTLGFYKLVTKKEALHAEMNLLSKLAKSTDSSEGTTMYCTLSPCIDCSKMIYQAGVKRVVYLDVYRNTDGLDFLEKCGVVVERLSNNKDKININITNVDM